MSKGLLKLVLVLLSYISLKNIQYLSEIAGYVLTLFPNSLRNNTKVNLKICFPHKNKEEIDDLTRESLKETLKSLLELGKCWIKYPLKGVNNIVQEEGKELVLNSLNEGRGVILFTPHIGNIEVLVSYISENFKCTIPYTPAKILSLDLLIKHARTLMGAKMVRANSGGVKSLLETLRKGNLVLMASDQVPQKKHGVISNFFGTPALSVSLISSLATRTKCPCHTVTCLRIKGGKGYKIIFSEKISELNSLNIQEGVNLMNRKLEDCIMKAPEQYAWEYKRFKHSTFINPY